MDYVVKSGVSRCVLFNMVWKASVEIKDVSFDKFEEGSSGEIRPYSVQISFLSARGEK